MIIELKRNTNKVTIEDLASKHRAFHIFNEDKNFLITSASVKDLDKSLENHAENHWVFATDMQLSSKDFLNRNIFIQKLGGK